MPTLIIAPEQSAFERLASELARGDEVAADRVLVVLAASGRTTGELQERCDRLSSEIDQAWEDHDDSIR